MRGLCLGVMVAVAFATVPAFAADRPADPASPVGIAGQFIIDTAGGRSYNDAYAVTRNDYNPHGIDLDALIAKLGLAKVSEDGTGAAVAPGELSILPQFNTPGGKFSPNADTPPMIPFAFLADGQCQAGYAVGFPAPSATYVADIGDAPCSAYSVEDEQFGLYRQLEARLGDADLEGAVRAAYTAAAAYSVAHGNYFVRDGVFAPLRDAIAAALAADYDTVVVPEEAAADLDAARVCLAVPGTELRIATNTYGDGITLAAVTDRRIFAYDYDPHKSSEIKVVTAADCMKPN
jgi:hypothetical protein